MQTVHRQHRALAVYLDMQMTALAGREFRPLLLQPALELVRVHGLNVKHFCCVCQAENNRSLTPIIPPLLFNQLQQQGGNGNEGSLQETCSNNMGWIL